MSEEDKYKQVQLKRSTDDKLVQAITKATDELHVTMNSRDMIVDFLASRYLAEAA